MPPHHRRHHGHHPHHRHRHPHPPNYRHEFLDALEFLIDEGDITTVDEMVHYAERRDEQEAVQYLRSKVSEVADVDLMLRALGVELEIVARREHESRLLGWKDRRVALVFPLPPHVHEPLLALSHARVLVPNGHHLPPHLRRRIRDAVCDSRACRRAISEADAIVLEVYRENGSYYVDDAVADVLDLRIIPVTTELIVHPRPHLHAEDVEFDFGTRTLSKV